MTPGSPHDLTWVAFRYVSGEMDAEEASAFEGQLSQDQRAREAVAEAVELAGAVVLASSGTADVLPIRRRRARFVAWLAAGVAACAAFVIGRHLIVSRAPAPALSGLSTPASHAMVLAWPGLREHEDVSPDTHPETLAWLEESPLPGEAGPEAIDDGTFPPWLVEAASLRGNPLPGRSESLEN